MTNLKKTVLISGSLLLSLALLTNTYLLDVKNEWKISRIFEQEGEMIRGGQEEVGFVDASLVAGKEHLLTWYLWNEELLERTENKIRVVAVNKNTGKVVTILNDQPVQVPRNDFLAKFPANLSFPDPGKWRLDVYLNDRHCGKVVVEVHDDETNT